MNNLILIMCLFLAPAAFAENASHRDAAQRVIEGFENKPVEQRAIDLVNAIEKMGMGMPKGKKELVSIFTEMLGSDAFKNDMQNIYMANFTEVELIRISELLNDPVFQKFIGSRMKIYADSQQVMSKYMQKAFE